MEKKEIEGYLELRVVLVPRAFQGHVVYQELRVSGVTMDVKVTLDSLASRVGKVHTAQLARRDRLGRKVQLACLV